MITRTSLRAYTGPCLLRGRDFLYLPPHPLLRPYISHYTLSFPSPANMTDQYTVLPSASSTLVFSLGRGRLEGALRGVNTRPAVVGAYANQFTFLLLVEFHPLGYYPLCRVDQHHLLDRSYSLEQIDGNWKGEILSLCLSATDVASLLSSLNAFFLPRALAAPINPALLESTKRILHKHGAMRTQMLSKEVFYSEKQLNRLFRREIGTSVKTFARIVRVNHALRILDGSALNLDAVAQRTGYHDQSHLIRDLKDLCGVTPEKFRNASIFYNETFKL